MASRASKIEKAVWSLIGLSIVIALIVPFVEREKTRDLLGLILLLDIFGLVVLVGIACIQKFKPLFGGLMFILGFVYGLLRRAAVVAREEFLGGVSASRGKR